MKRRMIAVGILLFTLLPGIADAGLFRHGRCCRPTKRCTVEKTEPCESADGCEGYAACADASQASYNAFAGPDGIYGVNTYTGQVYKYSDGMWELLGTSIP